MSKTISASPLAAGLICQVSVCGCIWTLVRVSKRKQVREMALSSRCSATHNYAQEILDNLSYSLFYRPWIPKRKKTKREMQTASQPPQALFPRSHNLLALTDYLTSLGSTLVFNSVRFSPPPSFSLTLMLPLFPFFMAPREFKQFRISIKQRSAGFNMKFDREHK